jgi:TRAP-type C4-dicarboxylate transport system permease large subunit
LITPPYGLCLLIAADLGRISIGAALRALAPFYLISLIVVLIAVLLPDVILWIPEAVIAGGSR